MGTRSPGLDGGEKRFLRRVDMRNSKDCSKFVSHNG